MRKLIITSIIWSLFFFALLYFPFSFAALSFNPLNWDNYSGLRLVFAGVIWGAILFSSVKGKVDTAAKYFKVQ